MADMSYPVTAEQYAALAEQGLTVEYDETLSNTERPEGDGWEYWADRITPDEHVAVWRRIVPIDE